MSGTEMTDVSEVDSIGEGYESNSAGESGESDGSEELSASEYDWLSLGPDEEILWASSPPLVTEAGNIIRGVFLCMTLILSPIGLPLLLSSYLRVKNRHYVMTNKKFYKKTGVLSVSTEESAVPNMQNMSYSQSFMGSQLGYGTVEISDASDTLSFTNVENPAGVKEELSKLVNQYGSQYTTGGNSTTQSQPGAGAISGAEVDALYSELSAANDELEEFLEILKNS